MARLVSIPVSLAIEAVMASEIDPGVSMAPGEPHLVKRWINTVSEIAQHIEIVDHQI